MQNKTLIIITGKLASGKSTLARDLSSSLNIACFIKDEYKEHLVDVYGYQNREENRKLSIKAVSIMQEEAKKIFNQGKSAILEANFRENEIAEIIALSERYGYKTYLFLLSADDKVLYERFLLRVPTRHIAHLSLGLDKDFDKFVNYNNDLATQVEKFDHINIDTTGLDINKVHQIVMEYLNK